MSEIGIRLCNFQLNWITFYSRSRPKREREGKNTIPLFIDFWGGSSVGGGSCIKQTMHGCLCICGPK